MTLTDWIGFIGVTILLVAYLLILLNKISKDGIVYIILNLAGAGIALVASFMLNYVPFIILEGAWTLASFVVLIGYLRKGNLSA